MAIETRYFCDRCNKKVEDISTLFWVAINKYYFYPPDRKEKLVCENCAEKLSQLLKESVDETH